MRLRTSRRLAVTGLLIFVVGTGCDDKSSVLESTPPPGPVVSDFSLDDTNPTSPRFGTSVSPRDYLGQISAWYFGTAT
jgi:hypothetical protein